MILYLTFGYFLVFNLCRVCNSNKIESFSGKGRGNELLLPQKRVSRNEADIG